MLTAARYEPPADLGRSTSRAETALVGVYEISKLLVSPHRLEVNLSGVLTLLSSFLDMGHGLIALLDSKGDPEVVVGSGWTETNAKCYFDRLPERAVGQIVATRMPLVVPNVAVRAAKLCDLRREAGRRSWPRARIVSR